MQIISTVASYVTLLSVLHLNKQLKGKGAVTHSWDWIGWT